MRLHDVRNRTGVTRVPVYFFALTCQSLSCSIDEIGFFAVINECFSNGRLMCVC